jgi:hypothetical protein
LHELSPDAQKELKIEFIADRELLDLIQELKALEGEMSVKEIVRRAMKAHIKAIQKKRSGPTLNNAKKDFAASGNSASTISKNEIHPTASPAEPPPATQSKTARTHIPLVIQRQVRSQSQNRCTYTDSISKRRCEKKHDLEIEHKIPVAKGGTNNPENLTLLCHAHNRMQAQRHFGKGKIVPSP